MPVPCPVWWQSCLFGGSRAQLAATMPVWWQSCPFGGSHAGLVAIMQFGGNLPCCAHVVAVMPVWWQLHLFGAVMPVWWPFACIHACWWQLLTWDIMFAGACCNTP